MPPGEARAVEGRWAQDDALGRGVGQDVPEGFLALVLAHAVVAFWTRRIRFAHGGLGIAGEAGGGVGAYEGEAVDAGGDGGAGEVGGAVAVDGIEVSDAARVEDAGGVEDQVDAVHQTGGGVWVAHVAGVGSFDIIGKGPRVDAGSYQHPPAVGGECRLPVGRGEAPG